MGNSERTHDIILSTIESVFLKAVLIVKTIISDQGPRNQGLVQKLNITPEKPYFIRYNDKIYLIFDSPHLLKSICNNLLTKILFHKEDKVS